MLENTFLENEFDGYELEYVPTGVAAMPPEIRMTWCKPEAIGRLGKPDVWRLDLPLGSEDDNRGRFRVYRRYSDKPLMIDINLLTRFFPAELSKALDRAAREELAAASALSAAAAGASPLSPYQSSA